MSAAVGALVATCMEHDFMPATTVTRTFVHPVVSGVGVQAGALARQKIGNARTWHPVADYAAGVALQVAASQMVDTFATFDPTDTGAGADKIENCYVLGCSPKPPAGVSGLPDIAAVAQTHLVIIDWQVLLPVDWAG